MGHRLQSKPWLFLISVAAWLLLLACEWQDLSGPAGHDLNHPAIRETACAAVIAWFLAAWLAVFRISSILACEVYVWGCAAFLLHLAMAFHLGHEWSHESAFEHVERESGFGPGIFVSYLFSIVWLADAMWCLLAFEAYRNRGEIWNAVIYGFMAFVIFNATVVYGHGIGRGLSAIAFLSLLLAKRRDERLINRV